MSVEPLRNECQKTKTGYKCYRGIAVAIGKKKTKASEQAKPTQNLINTVEVVIKKEEQEQEKVGPGICDYDYEAIESLVKKRKTNQSALEMKKIPFREGCVKTHFRYMYLMSELQVFPKSYIQFLRSFLRTLDSNWGDSRVLGTFEFLSKMVPWGAGDWKLLYSALQSSTSMDFSRLLNLAFHLDTKDRKTQILRLKGLIQDIDTGKMGFPRKHKISRRLPSLIREPDNEDQLWFVKPIFSTWKSSVKSPVDTSKRVLEALKSLRKFDLSKEQNSQVLEWMALASKLAVSHDDSREFFMSFVREIDRSIEKLDETIDKEAVRIDQLKSDRGVIIQLAKAQKSQLFAKVERDHRLKDAILFCLKNEINCNKIVPSAASIEKRLGSKKKEDSRANHRISNLYARSCFSIEIKTT